MPENQVFGRAGGGIGKDKIECCECTVSVAGQIPQPLVIGEM